MTETAVLCAARDGAMWITLNRPAAMNSITPAIVQGIEAALVEALADPQVSAVVLTGTGRAFCAGADLKYVREQTQGDESATAAFLQTVLRLMNRLETFPKPVIAAINGLALAGGLELVLCCDLAFAADDARFATPGVNIGLWCITPMVALSRAVSRKHAMQMLLTGRLFDAQHAFRIGLVNEVVAEAQLDQAVRETALEIASKSTFTVALGKQSFYRQADMGLSDAYEYASELVVRNLMAEDAVEGISAFVEKRTPVWKGR